MAGRFVVEFPRIGNLPLPIYISNLDCGVQEIISKFADDTNIGHIVNNKEDSLVLHRHIGGFGRQVEDEGQCKE